MICIREHVGDCGLHLVLDNVISGVQEDKRRDHEYEEAIRGEQYKKQLLVLGKFALAVYAYLLARSVYVYVDYN